MMLKLFRSALLAGFCAFLCSPGLAPVCADEPLPPVAVKVSTPIYQPDWAVFDPQLGTYQFTVSWEGIPAASGELSVEQEGDRYHIVSTVKTVRAIELFYKLRFRQEAWISALDFAPIKSLMDQQENSREKSVKLFFNPDRTLDTVRTNSKDGTTAERYTLDNFTLDPVAAAFLARAMPWEVGMSRQFDTFNGRSRYLITMTALRHDVMMFNNQERKVWVIEPKVENLTDPKSDSKLRSAQIYLADDPSREVLQIVSKVFIGSVKTRLTGFTPSGRSSNRPALAALRRAQPKL